MAELTLADEIGLIASWLTGLDQDRAAIMLECAYRDLYAACWALERPARLAPEGWTTPDGQQAAERPLRLSERGRRRSRHRIPTGPVEIAGRLALRDR